MLPAAGGEPVNRDAALRIADVFSAVRCLSDSAASLPLHAYRRADGGRERYTGRLADLIDRPGPATTTANLTGQLVAHLALDGNAFLAKYRDADGQITQLGALDPTRVTVALERGEPVYTLSRADGVTRHGVEDIIHLRAMSVDGLTGLSPIRQARQALGLAQSLSGLADSFARNSGRPSGILTLSSGANPEQLERLRSGFTVRHGGPAAAGHTAVMTGDVSYQSLSLSMQDAEFVAQRQLSTAEICRIFRIPTWMLSASSGDALTYSNVESQALAFVKFTLAPWLTIIEQALSADADLSPRNVYVAFAIDGLLRADAATRAQVYTAALDPLTGWMSRAEVRALEDLPAEPATAPQPSEMIA